MAILSSVKNVLEVTWVCGPGARRSGPPDVLIELPHGATKLAHLQAIKALISEYPGPEYDDFFLVNTDQGSPEYGFRLAELLTDDELWVDTPEGALAHTWCRNLRILIVRSLLPRTLVDVNRVWSSEEEATAAGLTCGVPSFITKPRNLHTLERLFRQYHKLVRGVFQWTCGAGGFAFILHTYAPISVSPIPGESIVNTLHRAYTPEFYGTYPVRPKVELITTPPGGHSLCEPTLCQALVANYQAVGVEARLDDPFDMHQATMGYVYAHTYPNQTLCMEISRAELGDPFSPFAEMAISPAKVDHMTRPIALAFFDYLNRHRLHT